MTPQEEIKSWLDGERNYSAGVALLQRYGKNKVLATGLAKAGKEKFEQNHKKLAYELGKIAGSTNMAVNPPSVPPLQRGTKPEAPSDRVIRAGSGKQQAADDFVPHLNSKPIDQYPPIIRRVKYEYAELFRKRSISHRKMAEIPEENSEANKQARAAHLAETKAISKRLELLYQHLQAHEVTGAIPDENELWPKQNDPQPLDDNIARLRTVKKNLQTSNGKDRNLLEYQQEKKGKKPAPMPDGPKRKKIEERIKEREKQIAEIEDKLFELGVSK